MYFKKNATDCKFPYQFIYVPIGEAKAQKLIAEPKIIVSQDFKTTFKQNTTSIEKHTVVVCPLFGDPAIKHCCVKHLGIKNKFRKNLCNVFLPEIAISLCPESSENISILLQEADLCFSKQNDTRNPQMASKQSVVVATQ